MTEAAKTVNKLSRLALAMGLDKPELRKQVQEWLILQDSISQGSVLPQASIRCGEMEKTPHVLAREKAGSFLAKVRLRLHRRPQTMRLRSPKRLAEDRTLYQRLRALVALVFLLSLAFVFAPSRLGSFDRNFPALFGSHSFETAFAADLPSASAHSGHDTGNGVRNFFRFGSRSSDHLKRSLIYVAGASGFAYTLWHGISMTQV
jgi:hypothetical protein